MSSPNDRNAKPGQAPTAPAAIRPAPPAPPPRVPAPMKVVQRHAGTQAPPPVQGVFASGQLSVRAAVPVPPPRGARTAQPMARGGAPTAPSVPAALSPNVKAPQMRAAGRVQAKAAGPAVQRKSDGSVDAFLVNLPPSHGGQPLPDAVLAKMESALGANFADVRVHVGPQASSIGALAFTRGSDIYFAPGQYNPSSLQGQQILGHELAHVVQQRQGRVSNPFGSGVAVVQDRQLEAEADRLGWRAAMSPGPREK